MKKTSLIIGGSKGIGFEITKTLLKRGDKVIIASRNTKDSKKGISIDLEDPIQVESFIKKIKIKKQEYFIISSIMKFFIAYFGSFTQTASVLSSCPYLLFSEIKLE